MRWSTQPRSSTWVRLHEFLDLVARTSCLVANSRKTVSTPLISSEAREKKSVSVDPKSKNRAFLLVGNEDWPFPVPLVRKGDKWSFDSKAGRQELLYRRIGANELDAIEICHGYVEAQYEYALQPHEGYNVNQYAQHIVSNPGKQDGLAWQNPDGAWVAPSARKSRGQLNRVTLAAQSPTTDISSRFSKGKDPRRHSAKWTSWSKA
jgi:hypothetical protein